MKKSHCRAQIWVCTETSVSFVSFCAHLTSQTDPLLRSRSIFSYTSLCRGLMSSRATQLPLRCSGLLCVGCVTRRVLVHDNQRGVVPGDAAPSWSGDRNVNNDTPSTSRPPPDPQGITTLTTSSDSHDMRHALRPFRSKAIVSVPFGLHNNAMRSACSVERTWPAFWIDLWAAIPLRLPISNSLPFHPILFI